MKMYHVMSVKQTLREDLAECAYQFSCRAADWSRSDMRLNLWNYTMVVSHSRETRMVDWGKATTSLLAPLNSYVWTIGPVTVALGT